MLKESLMRNIACLALAICALLAVSTAAQSIAPRHHHHKRHVTHAAPAPTLNRFGPYAHPGDGDDDGLSRDADDCNKGCIDGNSSD
jgi:hypothetical protein